MISFNWPMYETMPIAGGFVFVFILMMALLCRGIRSGQWLLMQHNLPPHVRVKKKLDIRPRLLPLLLLLALRIAI